MKAAGRDAMRPLGPPPVVAEPGWVPFKPFRLEAGRGTFVSSDTPGDRLRVAYFERTESPRLVGRAWFGPGAEGPPGHAHGGSIAAVLDEGMGAAVWLEGRIAVAVRLVTDFRRMLPLGTDARLEAWVVGSERRKMEARGRLVGADGTLFAESEGLFVDIDPLRFRDLLERAARAQGLDPDAFLRR